MPAVPITETALLTEAQGDTAKGGIRYRARIIEGDRQGSSGYYSAKMLRQFGPQVFVEGLKVFLDHPGWMERSDRPERSVRDLAGRLATTAKYEGDGLYAEVEVYPHFAPVIEAMAGDIGMSIRASGTSEVSTDEAIPGPMITSLTAAASVDFVTAAGCGGKLVSLLESAVVLREGHGMNAGDLRRSLQSAVDDAYADACCWAWVSDYSDDYVIYHLSGRDADAGLYQRTYTVDAAGTATLTGDPVEVNVRTEYVPTLTDTTEGAPAVTTPPVVEAAPGAGGVDHTLLAEAIARALRTPAGDDKTTTTPTTLKEAVPVTTPEIPPTGAPPTGTPVNPYTIEAVEASRQRTAQLERELNEARADQESTANDRLARDRAEQALNTSLLENARFRAMESARSATQTVLNSSGLPDCVHPRVIAAVCGLNGAALPLSEASRELDSDELKTRIASTVESWKVLVGQIAESLGVDGRVRGLGAPVRTGGELTEAQAQERMKERFIRKGMTEAQATIAARGRG